jgi:PAS domain S-box-containing protein
MNFPTTACIYLIFNVLVSVQGSFLSSSIASFMAVFAPPILSLWVSESLNVAAIVAFLATSAVITYVVFRARNSAEETLSDIESRKSAEDALRRSEAFLAEAQRLSHTGSFGWSVSTGEIIWSDETFRIFQYDRTTKPTLELVLQRVHPEDAALLKRTFERASQDGKSFDLKYRTVMPHGFVKYVHVVARGLRDESGSIEFVGAVMDVTAAKQVEDALRTSEQQWRDVFENNPTMYFMLDAETIVMAVNPFGAEQLGYTVDELVGRPVLEVFYEPDREQVKGNVALCLKHLGQSMSWELRKVRKDGSVIWVRETARAVFRANKRVLLIACEDVTGRKKAQEKVREQEIEIRQMLDLAPMHIAVLGPDRSRLSINQAALEYYGLTLEEWRNSAPGSFFHPDDLGRMRSETESKFLSRSPHETEGRLKRKDGEYRWFLFRYSAVPDEQGRITRWYLAATDIDDRKQAEGKLRHNEANLHEAQRLGRMGSWTLNVSSGAIFASPELFRILGRDPNKEKLTPEAFRESVHPEDRPFIDKTVGRARAEKTDFEFDHRMIIPDGSIKHVHSVAHPVFNDSGDLVEYIGTIMDVTERKRAEEALRQAQADLAHVSRVTTMGELTASLAHEVNQPIAAAITDANTCLRWINRDRPNLEEARAAAMRVVNDGTRAAEIISRVRLLFKKGTPQRELVDVNDLIRETIALLRSQLSRSSVSVRTDLAEDLPQVTGDRVQLQQVLMNLMLNGIDAMKEMNAGCELTIKSRQSENGQLLISVSDTGVGLPPQQANHIFDAFFTTKLQGTGMGLTISRSIIESHGGTLWAAGNAPRGASFHFTLPTKPEVQE